MFSLALEQMQQETAHMDRRHSSVAPTDGYDNDQRRRSTVISINAAPTRSTAKPHFNTVWYTNY